MAVRQEIKSQLAKLLATEDLIVEHKNVETAQFDVVSRVLTLPVWDKASSGVYDMLVGHEVGHALFTPDDNWIKERKIPPVFVNIVEDARIEKFMKRKYPGLAKSFYYGYQELNDNDFFDVDGQDLDDFNLADRINLHYKIGNFIDLDFSLAEKQIIKIIDQCETFADTLDAAETLYNYCKKRVKEDGEKNKDGEANQELDISFDFTGEGDGQDFEDELDESGSDSVEPEEGESYGGTAEHKEGGDKGSDDLDIKTVEALSDALKKLTNITGSDSQYFEIPKIDLSKVIISNKLIHDNITTSFSEQEKEWSDKWVYDGWSPEILFKHVDSEFIKFKKSAQKEVNYLVKEFECRKAADNYSRSATNRTGILDTTKLHTYRFNEDIFKRITTVPDGKNHGLIFILDWSGSMAHVLADTLKQLYNLLWFCKKVNIPFEVYAFTNEYPNPNENGYSEYCYEKKEGLLHINENFSLMNMFTSKVKGKVLEEQMKNIFRIGLGHGSGHVFYHLPLGMRLSGTPLNEALLCLHQILPQFKKENGVQKVQCVVLTDGEAHPLTYHKKFQRHWEDSDFMGCASMRDGCFLRDRKTGHTYAMDGNWWTQTDIFLRNLRDNFTDVNFIGIRVMASRDAGSFIRRYCGYHGKLHDTTKLSWVKNRSFSIKNSGYHTYFGLSSNALANDDEFEVKEDATKAQIRSAFKKSLKSKKMNKKVLGEFIELVA